MTVVSYQIIEADWMATNEILCTNLSAIVRAVEQGEDPLRYSCKIINLSDVPDIVPAARPITNSD